MKISLLCITLFLVACSSSSPPKEKMKNPSVGELAAQIPPQMRAKSSSREEFPAFEEKEQPAGAAGTVGAGASILPPLPDADDLVWTDPDNPDQNLGSVEAAFTKPVKDSWQLSFQAATRLSYAEGKPLMIWFTDSKGSPTCKSLGRELLSQKSFESWSEEHVIKLRVDLNPEENQREMLQRKQAYAQALRKKFRVKGSPTVLVLGNNGETVGRYTGYTKGSSNYYWGRLKNAVSTIDEGYFDWRTRMEDKGYRMWEGKNGVKLFAKLLRYNEGSLWVVEPNGRKTSFHESGLSAGDQQWIEKQKKR